MAKITKIIKGILPKNLGALGNLKESKEVVPVEKQEVVPVEKQEVVPAQRRDFLKRAGGAALQTMLPRGALTNLVKKGLESVEPVKETPFLDFKLSDLDVFRNKLVDEIKLVIDNEGPTSLMLDYLPFMSDADFIAEAIDNDALVPDGFEGSFLEKMIDELQQKFPNATDQEIFDKFGELFEGAATEFENIIPKSKLKYKTED
jgi:hypothetical protein